MNNSKRSQTLFNPEAIQREIMQRLVRLGLGALMVVLAVFLVVGFVVFPLMTAMPNGPEEADWSLLEGFVGLITLALFIGGGVFVFIEYINNEVQQRRESAESSFNIYRDIFERMTDLEETASRRWIIINIRPWDAASTISQGEWLAQVQAKLFEVPPGWKDEVPPGQAHLKRVLNTLDFLGYVAEHFWHMEDDLVEWLSPPIAKVWERVGLYVEHEAEQRHEPDYYQAARQFGTYCTQWRQQRFGQSIILDKGV